MDGKRYDLESLAHEGSGTASLISVEQLQRLVQLLDRSDVSELELKQAEEGLRLVLRKAQTPESNDVVPKLIDAPVRMQSMATAAPPLETKHYISAHFVGIFHAGARPGGRPLAAPGEHVKVGQLVATIESLNVINEVESSVAGQVVEILVQDGQAVEYGQHLIIVDSATREK